MSGSLVLVPSRALFFLFVLSKVNVLVLVLSYYILHHMETCLFANERQKTYIQMEVGEELGGVEEGKLIRIYYVRKKNPYFQ